MKFEVGKKYLVKLGRKHGGSLVEAEYLEEREKENAHSVKAVKVIKWNGDNGWLYLMEKYGSLCFIVDGSQIIREMK